jgi:hypothetical protein
MKKVFQFFLDENLKTSFHMKCIANHVSMGKKLEELVKNWVERE